MKINIETIPHTQQRYDTVGDYWLDQDGTYQVRISSLSTQVREQAVLIHELHEMFLALAAGISFAEIDRFDIEFEKNRRPGNVDEPGDDPKCPVYRQHQKATIVERLFILETGDNWQEYEKEVESL